MSIKSNTLFINQYNNSRWLWMSPFTGLDYWTGLLDWTTGLSFFSFYGFLMAFLKLFVMIFPWMGNWSWVHDIAVLLSFKVTKVHDSLKIAHTLHYKLINRYHNNKL